ncbi:chromatin-modulating protein mrc1 [Desmophyllum pertusum]|uniref:Chromatin-modulating protein mrc1 n=1 Tax=Desmophyllum pertusum TaxID=174260 RepID=A0A9X0A6P4_9CNID|nr:chromatin-modulating protein mrc1 [Desmophyllum pertusum]
MDFVNKISSMFKGFQKWIGLNDRLKEDQFVWSDGTPFNSSRSYSNWRNKEPNNKGNEDCVGLYFNLWNDNSCSGTNFYICERPKGKLSCPDGWFLHGLSCYKASKDLKTWLNAKQDCHVSGGYLLKIDDATEQNFIEVFLRITGLVLLYNNVWIGFNDIEHEGTYRWEVDNSTVDFTKWEPGQPNNIDSQDCGEIGAKAFFGLWNDRECTVEKCYICEKPANGMSCYQCSSNTSFAECTNKQKIVNCTSLRNYCYKQKNTTAGDKNAVYYKGCISADKCRQHEKHSLECCSYQLCNKESGLSCFKCSSTVSHEECQAHRQEVTCKSSMADRCYYASMQQTSQDGSSVTKRFQHGCTNNNYCNNTAKYFDECITSSEACKVRCCSGNLCNEVTKGEIPTQENTVSNTPTQENAVSDIKIAYISFGVAFLLLLLCFVVVFWCYRKTHRKRIERSTRSRREIIPFDKWELLPDQIEYEEELGRGAFGVVYKATLKKRQGIEVFDTRKGLEPSKANKEVAVKELQGTVSWLMIFVVCMIDGQNVT